MDESAPANDGASPMKRDDEVRPVVWTPEDASRFLTSAIHEAQKPLADALKKRPITTSTLVLVLLLMFAAGAGIAWILFMQLEKTERIADSARSNLDSAVMQQHQLQARSDTLQARLEAAQAEQERLLSQYEQETTSLRGQVADKRDNEEELRKAQADLNRFRRQNELLKSQISGLEMEKQALARQLDAVRAMADDGFEIPGESPYQPAPPEDIPSEPMSAIIQPEPPVVEAPAVLSTQEEEPLPLPEPEAVAEPSAEPEEELATPDTPEPVEIVDQDVPVTETAEPASEPATEPEPEPVEDGESVAITADAAPAVETVTVTPVVGEPSAIGTLTTGENGDNPPTLYEANQLNDAAPAAASDEPVAITGAVAATIPDTPQPPEVEAEAEAPEASANEQPEEAAEEPAAAMDSGAVQYSKQLSADEPAPADEPENQDQDQQDQPEESEVSQESEVL